MVTWLVPYITFNGNCEEAVMFYQKALGGETQILRFGDSPPNPAFPVPEHHKQLVLHAELRKDGHIIRFSDTLPESPSNMGNNISFSLELESREEFFTTYEQLSKGGKIEMEPQQTFFSTLYAKFTDQFGVIWQLTFKK